MAANILIQSATESDLPEIAAISCAGMEPDVLTRFLFNQRQAEAARMQTESLMASLGRRFTHPTNRYYILKTVGMQTGELIGYVLVRWEDSTWVSGKPTPPLDDASKLPDFRAHHQRLVKNN